MLTSSDKVTAMIISASSAPAAASTSGCEPCPTNPRTSSVSRTISIWRADVSITETSFSSAASRSAMPYPTCPAPQTITPMTAPCARTLLSSYAERFQFAMQRRTLHANKLRRARNIAAEPVDLGDQIFLLETLARLTQRKRHDVLVGFRRRARQRVADFSRKKIGRHWRFGIVAARQYHQAFDIVAKLAKIAGPAVRLQNRHRIGADLARLDARLFGDLLHEILDQ